MANKVNHRKKHEIKTTYYDKFQCLASECPITCCKEWKISVDEKSSKKWNDTRWSDHGEAEHIENAKTKKLSEYLIHYKEADVICLNEQKECPFLDQQKLCKLVLRYGDQILSKTCREFPREIHEFKDRREYSLAACCPAVVNFWRVTQDVLDKEAMEKMESDIKNNKERHLYQLRMLLISCLEDQKISIEKALLMGFYLLLEGKEGRVSYQQEELEELSQAVDEMEIQLEDTFLEDNALFLDMTENYWKQGIYRIFLEPLREEASRMETDDGYIENEFIQEYGKFLKVYRDQESLLRKYLIAEMFGQLLLADYDWQDMSVAMQWIGMEYAIMRQAAFLTFKQTGTLSYEQMKEVIVYIARMTGYDDADIWEYLEESFQTLIWEWGYFAFIIGNRKGE